MNKDLLKIAESYYICALWSSFDENDEPMDYNYTLLDLSFNFRTKSEKDIQEFVELASDMLDDWSEDQIGHNLWLTRNGHGTGFWDRDMPYKDELTELCGFGTKFTEIYLYINDSGEIDFNYIA